MESVDIDQSPESPVFVDVSDAKLSQSQEKAPLHIPSDSSTVKDESFQDTEDVDGPTSSAENIIPLEKLKNGWFAMSGYMMATAQKVKASAVETYNSESVTNFKQKTYEVVTKTSEAIAPAWEKTCEAAAPIWNSTCETATYAAEKTKENAVLASETVRLTKQSAFNLRGFCC